MSAAGSAPPRVFTAACMNSEENPLGSAGRSPVCDAPFAAANAVNTARPSAEPTSHLVLTSPERLAEGRFGARVERYSARAALACDHER